MKKYKVHFSGDQFTIVEAASKEDAMVIAERKDAYIEDIEYIGLSDYEELMKLTIKLTGIERDNIEKMLNSRVEVE